MTGPRKFLELRKTMNRKTLSAGVIIIRWLDGVPQYLLLRVFNYWDFPKGMVTSGEDPLKAALREVREETGLEKLSFNWGYEYKETPPYRAGKVARYYLAEYRNGRVYLPVSPELGHPEHDEFRWLAYHEARPLLAERVKPILDWANAKIVQSA